MNNGKLDKLGGTHTKMCHSENKKFFKAPERNTQPLIKGLEPDWHWNSRGKLYSQEDSGVTCPNCLKKGTLNQNSISN